MGANRAIAVPAPKQWVRQGWTVICIVALLLVLPAGSAKAAGCTNISPLPCSDVLVAFPYQLDFGSDAGKILDSNGVGTGFTMVDPPTNGTGYLPANLAVDTAAGTLKITTTKGTAFKATDSQDNTLESASTPPTTSPSWRPRSSILPPEPGRTSRRGSGSGTTRTTTPSSS